MDKGHVMRRLIHMTAPVYLVYYWLPEYMLDIWKGYWMISILLIVSILEGIRIWKGMLLPGMRDYERKYMSAYYQAAVGFVVAMLVFPMHFVVVAFFGLAFVDPLIGELRGVKSGLYPGVPVALYLIIALSYLLAFSSIPIESVMAISVVGAAAGMVFEYPSNKWVNDDLLMNLGPLLAMSMVWAVIQFIYL